MNPPPADSTTVARLVCAVEVRPRFARRVELVDAPAGDLVELRDGAELNRVRRTGLGARRLEVGLLAVVAERALVGPPVREAAVEFEHQASQPVPEATEKAA